MRDAIIVRVAPAGEEIRLGHYTEPQVDISTGDVVEAEAMSRRCRKLKSEG